MKESIAGAIALVVVMGFALPKSQPIYVSSKAELTTLSTKARPIVIRDGFTEAADAPQLMYTASTSACTLNSGAGDGGFQVPSPDGKCWIASFPSGRVAVEAWGCSGDGTTDMAACLNG